MIDNDTADFISCELMSSECARLLNEIDAFYSGLFCRFGYTNEPQKKQVREGIYEAWDMIVDKIAAHRGDDLSTLKSEKAAA